MNDFQTQQMVAYQRAQKGYRNLFANVQSRRTAKRGRIQVLRNSRVVSDTPLEGQVNKPNWTKYQR